MSTFLLRAHHLAQYNLSFQYGFAGRLHLTDRALQKVKNKRNELAHGEKSFTDLGRELAVEGLESDSSAVFGILKKIANEVDAYLRDRRYLAPAPAYTATVDTEA